MKLDFCAICGKKTDLHQHHIEPVVFSGISRGRAKGYYGDKPLKDCTSMEVFRWLFNQGIITDDGEITVCSYHHNIMHGIVKFQKAEHTTLIKAGIARAKANGIKCGRPKNPNTIGSYLLVRMVSFKEELKREWEILKNYWVYKNDEWITATIFID